MNTVSRQRRWQLRKRAAGCCTICGKSPLVCSTFCLEHKLADRQRKKNRYYRNKADLP